MSEFTKRDYQVAASVLFAVATAMLLLWGLSLLPHAVAWPIHLALTVVGVFIMCQFVFRLTRLVVRKVTHHE